MSGIAPRLGVTLAAAAMVLAGCSDDDDAAPTTTTTAAVESPATTADPTTSAPTTSTTASSEREPHPNQTVFRSVAGIEVDGDSIWAATDQAGEIIEIDRDTGAVLTRVDALELRPLDVAIGSDGTLYWAGFDEGAVAVIENGESVPLATLTLRPSRIVSDGDELLVSQSITPADRNQALVPADFYAVPTDGGEPRLITRQLEMNGLVVVDGEALGPTDATTGVGAITGVDLSTGEKTVYVGDLPAMSDGTLGPDGALYAVAPLERQILRYELGSDEVTVAHELPNAFLSRLSFADDGTLYVTSTSEPTLLVIAPDGTQSELRIGSD